MLATFISVFSRGSTEIKISDNDRFVAIVRKPDHAPIWRHDLGVARGPFASKLRPNRIREHVINLVLKSPDRDAVPPAALASRDEK